MGLRVTRKRIEQGPSRRPAFLGWRPGRLLRHSAWRAVAPLLLAAGLVLCPAPTYAQPAPPDTPPAAGPALPGPRSAPGPLSALRSPELQGRTVEAVQVRGNRQVATPVIQNLIRTKVGDPFDAQTVAEDYQRIYNLRLFRNVEARAEPTATGVIVSFVVTEERQINSIRFNGNRNIEDQQLRSVVDVRPGEAVDPFRVALARQAIENLFKDNNFALVHVEVDQSAMNDRGDVVFNITEGPQVRVRKTDFYSATGLTFSKDRLRDQIKTTPYFFIFRPGKYDPQVVEEDVASLRRFYESQGFFDARIGRKIIQSPDLSEVQIDFTIEEGPRYVVDRVTFAGNTSLSDDELRKVLKLTEGRTYDNDILQRDVREIVRAYSLRGGFIYQPQGTDPDYMRIEPKPKFLPEVGHVELVYNIREGKEFKLRNLLVKGNSRTQDLVVQREFRDFLPGSQFNSGELQDAEQRLRRLPYFQTVTVTPIGDDPGVRDLLVEVTEQRTASFNIGAGINSNGGVAGAITFEERNFDIGALPASPTDLPPFSERAFKGRGQTLRVSFEPGTEQTNAIIHFVEPYLFDQPFTLIEDAYLLDRFREHYADRRLGDTIAFAHRFDYVHSIQLALRGEVVDIHRIEDRRFRAQEYLDAEGDSVITSVALTLRRDTTNPGLYPDRGTVTELRAESYGALGGDYSFQKFTANFQAYQTLSEDLLDRKTILAFRGQVGFIPIGNSVFFERFYGGGIGGVRGFRFRGISPRGGRADDPVGGDFSFAGTTEVNFPVVGDSLRGVAFVDVGDVEPNVRFGTIRSSVGVGVRLVLPFFGQTPLAIDFGVPVTKNDQDDTQLISFSFGFLR